jgi:capsid protein
LTQIVDDPSIGTTEKQISIRLNEIDPQRLDTFTVNDQTPGLVLGVEHTETGKPIRYWILKDDGTGLFVNSVSLQSEPVRAENIIHGYVLLEADQARGVPWLATALQVMADLRDYKESVLDSAKFAALYGVMLTRDDEDGAYIEVNEEIELEKGTLKTMPPGWTPHQMKAEQPSTGYLEFSNSLRSEVGRPQCMPLMKVNLDSSNHNFSSARFDAQNYNKANAKIQSWIPRIALDRLVDRVREQAEQKGMLPKAPADLKTSWEYEPPPEVDPNKEAKASTERLANSTTTLKIECAKRGLNWKDVINQRAKEKELMIEMGLIVEGEGFENEESRMLRNLIDSIEDISETRN